MEKTSCNDHVPVSKHVLVICSGGGHWVQMKRILPAFEGHLVSVATVDLSCADNAGFDFYSKNKIPDFNRKNLLPTLLFVPKSLWLVRKLKPTHVVSTGAAPGIITLVIARLMGCKTLWVDSIANTKKLSLSGRLACVTANKVFTQWEHLNGKHGATYVGKVI
ncbi:hypothetical protein [Marinobacterium rhizophilum]|uniref:hypothetical protein n=1 Tax=Marinobacterium rhizophilum TaxID=420402 RepID=UPI0009FDF544|nr:hypothetical protein [Marinobacterium rhizophilum]